MKCRELAVMKWLEAIIISSGRQMRPKLNWPSQQASVVITKRADVVVLETKKSQNPCDGKMVIEAKWREWSRFQVQYG
jgi:hypothetical protein